MTPCAGPRAGRRNGARRAPRAGSEGAPGTSSPDVEDRNMIRYCKSAASLAVATGLLAGSGVAQEAPSTARGGIRIEVRFSRQLAVLDFMKRLRPSAPTNPLKTLFANSELAK